MTNDPQLKLYDSLTRKKRDFLPQNPKRVTMYNCGPTVYSYAHIGNARAAVVADVLFRLLRHIYGPEHVIYARNITDVDDKIIAAAKESSVDISVITEKYARIYNEDLAAIGCLAPTHQPKCTDHIGGMVAMISELLKKEFAYESDGHVFFDVSKYEEYGQLSGNTLSQLKKGSRVGEGEVARKKNAADFVLWKPPLDGVGWDAPFGNGRPGWHIECSAMAKSVLTDGTGSDTIDIHCGGVDLKFPHHENEIAQSACAHGGAALANYWVHNEFLNMGDTKMSKSLGNVKLIRDLLKNWDGEVIRLALLKAHYRNELVWTENLLRESKAQLDGWYRLLISAHQPSIGYIEPDEHIEFFLSEDLAMLDVLMRLNQLAKEAGVGVPKGAVVSARSYGRLVFGANLIGLLQKTPEEWFKGSTSENEEAEINALIAERAEVKTKAITAKKAGDKAAMGRHFARSDEIRDLLTSRNIILEDGPDGTTWRKG